MADQAKTDATVAVAFFFYTASNGQVLPFPAIETFDSIEGAQVALEAANIQGGKPQALLAYPALAGAIAATTASGKNFPENVEEKLQTLSDSLVPTDALVAAWELVQESHITDQATALLDVPTERADLIAQIIANNPADFVSTEVATEAGEMTVSFVAVNDGGAEPDQATEEVVETTTEEIADLTPEEEAAVETTEPETGIIAETTEVSALAHYEAPEGGVVVSNENLGGLLTAIKNTSQANADIAATNLENARILSGTQRTIEILANAVVKPTEKVIVEAEVVNPPAEA